MTMKQMHERYATPWLKMSHDHLPIRQLATNLLRQIRAGIEKNGSQRTVF
jgi:hypothetical protein